MKYLFDQITSDFKCKHCQQYISTDPALSGVNNRNHCPYCLWSRHMDLYRAGDRLCACKAVMRPVGLTVKRLKKKYGSGLGELMLIHCCQDCGGISINRTAADDDVEILCDVFQSAGRMETELRARIESQGIQILGPADRALVKARLFGQDNELPVRLAVAG